MNVNDIAVYLEFLTLLFLAQYVCIIITIDSTTAFVQGDSGVICRMFLVC